MCGITGIFSVKKVSELQNRILAMNNSIIHRGPDAGGVIIDGNIALGHRRLSIIDTSVNANQPMISKSGIWTLVFNGEIYNFNEIKSELKYVFKTNSDTEVILAAVEEKGIKWFLNIANGMFAMALYNSKTKHIYLVRDRLGIKPLYYFNDGEKLVFSSEIKGILSSGLVKAKFNEFAVDEYLGNRYIREPYTFFEDIYQLNSGCYIEINDSLESKEYKYWDLPDNFNTDKNYDEKNLAELFEQELIKSIKYRLISDVPVGTYLSGGVDSSLITAIVSNNKNESLNTFTIGFSEINEFKYSSIIAKKYNTAHHEILMEKKDYLENQERLIGYKDAPLAVPNEIPLAVMSTKLKEKVTVVLSGEGADELMGGYGRIYRKSFDFENQNSNHSFYEYFIKDYEYVSREIRDKFISYPKEYRKYFDKKIEKDFSNKSNEENIFRFFHKYHVKGLLNRVDMTTMQASVEARVPFLDHNLIEFVYNKIPYTLKLKWNSKNAKQEARNSSSNIYSEKLDIPKYLLRKISYNYLPREIIERKKVGFPVPLTEWFDNLEQIARDILPKAPWLNQGLINDLIDESRSDVRSGQVLWMFINIEIFRKQYFFKDWEW
jgi:asparagine synthase (glutamine-hydrolysing)